MPTFANFLKKVLCIENRYEEDSEKEKHAKEEELKIIPKMKDPGGFYASCAINNVLFEKVFYDLRSSVSVMPLSLSKILDVGDLHPTSMTLELADLMETRPLGIVKDVPMKIENTLVPIDFVVLDIKFNDKYTLLLGRPFLASS